LVDGKHKCKVNKVKNRSH